LVVDLPSLVSFKSSKFDDMQSFYSGMNAQSPLGAIFICLHSVNDLKRKLH
jgi:hypothetical protein